MIKIKNLKQILTVLLSILILLFLNEGKVKASLQSNPYTQYKNNLTTWMQKFRDMEKTGETMGLNEILNEDLTPSSESNNIDIHMIKTTEYGATAILSASAYGNSDNVREIATTTGNDTGVILNTSNWEWTAGGLVENFSFADKRYYDTYTTNINSARVGDALGNTKVDNSGCAKWHLASNADWISNIYSCFLRGRVGIFSYYHDGVARLEYSRGIVVCGYGI